MEGQHIDSPTELAETTVRGPVLGVTRINARAGIVATCLMAVVTGLIVYGISTSGARRVVSTTAPALEESGQAPHWWDKVSSTPRPAPQLPVVVPTPARIVLPQIAHVTIGAPVPNIAPLQHLAPLESLGSATKEARRQALLVAAAGSPIGVPLGQHGEESASQPSDPRTSGPALFGREKSAARPPSDMQGSGASDEILADVHEPSSSFTLREGSVIAATLLTGIDAALPGVVVAQVRSDVFDSASGRYRLIPQGSTLTGTYDSRVVQGQRRVLVMWNRVYYPDGSHVELYGMPGTDATGYAGFSASVDEHVNKAFNAALLLSIISAGAQLSQPQHVVSEFGTPDVGQTVAGAVGAQLAAMSSAVVQRQLGVAPTLEVAPGYHFDVIVSHSIAFAEPFDDAGEAP